MQATRKGITFKLYSNWAKTKIFIDVCRLFFDFFGFSTALAWCEQGFKVEFGNFSDVSTFVISTAITSYGRVAPGLDVVQSRTTVRVKTFTASKTVTLRASRSAGTRLVPTTSATRSSRSRRRNRSVSWTAPRTASWRSSVPGRAVTPAPSSTRLKYTSLRLSYIKIHDFLLGIHSHLQFIWCELFAK